MIPIVSPLAVPQLAATLLAVGHRRAACELLTLTEECRPWWRTRLCMPPARAAITTEDGIVQGLKAPWTYHKGSFTGEAAGQWRNLGNLAGLPGAWTLGTPGMAGAAVSGNALGGALPFENPSAGNAYLAQLAISVGANIVGVLLYDLLWYQSGIVETTTTAQTINSVAWPARSRDGTSNGAGVEIWMHCTTATTNTAAITNTTYSYTNQAGTSGRSAGLVFAWPATAVAGTMVPFGLQGSDTGVRSVQSVTLGTSYGGGQVELIALRSICFIPFVGATSGALLDWAQLGLPQLYNDSALYMAVLLSGTAAGITVGAGAFAHG